MRFAISALAVMTFALTAVLARQAPTQPKSPPVLASAARPGAVLTGFTSPIWAVAASGDGGSLLAAGENGALGIWTEDAAFGVRQGNGPCAILIGHKGPVLALAVAGNTVVSGGADGKVIFWDMAVGKPARTLDVGSPVRAVAVSSDGNTVAAAGEGVAVALVDAMAGKLKVKLEGPDDWVQALAFSPDGKRIAVAGYGGHLRVYEVTAGKKLYDVEVRPAPANAPPPPIIFYSAVAFSPDDKLIAVGGSDGEVQILQAVDGKLLRSLTGHTGAVTSLAFHPGNEFLASASKDRTVRLWNPAGGQMLKALEGHTAWVQGVTFFARGTRLASAGADQTVRVWDLTDPSKK